MNPDQVAIMHSTVDETTVRHLPVVMYLHNFVCPRNKLEPISIWVLCLPYPWNKFLKIRRVCNSCRLVVTAVKSLNHLFKSILFWSSQIFSCVVVSINIKCKMLLTIFFVKSVC